MNRSDYYTVNEASIVLGKSVQTIYKWLRDGRLIGTKNPLTRQYMILKTDVEGAMQWV